MGWYCDLDNISVFIASSDVVALFGVLSAAQGASSRLEGSFQIKFKHSANSNKDFRRFSQTPSLFERRRSFKRINRPDGFLETSGWNDPYTYSQSDLRQWTRVCRDQDVKPCTVTANHFLRLAPAPERCPAMSHLPQAEWMLKLVMRI